jgi:hypothetical protein
MGAWVLSHETALDLYELCDVNPAGIDVTVPRSYCTHRPGCSFLSQAGGEYSLSEATRPLAA